MNYLARRGGYCVSREHGGHGVGIAVAKGLLAQLMGVIQPRPAAEGGDQAGAMREAQPPQSELAHPQRALQQSSYGRRKKKLPGSLMALMFSGEDTSQTRVRSKFRGGQL